MMKFIDDGYNDPRDRLQLMLELTSELLPGAEVYKLYDSILSTCADPQRAYLHLSVVAALADPLPISQISELLGPGEGRDVETALVQLRSVMDIPTDSSLPVNIYHSSVRDYVSDPSNCSLFRAHDMTPPQSLLAFSSLRLMIQHIPENNSLLDAILKLQTQSQAMESHDTQDLKHTLAFMVIQQLQPLQVLIGLLWLRGYRSPELHSWLETRDGYTWLQTQGALDWLQTEGGRDWLQTQGGQNWLQILGTGGRDWLRTQGGLDWLQTQGGLDWLQTQGGNDWLGTQGGNDWLGTQSGNDWLGTQGGNDWLGTQSGNDWLGTQSGNDWLGTRRGNDWLRTQGGRDWLQIQGGRGWLPTQGGCNWLRTHDGWDWLPTQGGWDWLRTQDGWDWLGVQDGRDWLRTQDGLDWSLSPSGLDWKCSSVDRVWLRTHGGVWMCWDDVNVEALASNEVSLLGGWLLTSEEWLQSSEGQRCLQNSEGQEFLQDLDGRMWLQTQHGQQWLRTPHGQAWQSTPAASVWVQMEEFSSTVEAINEFMTTPELSLLPAFQVIQQLKSLPDFLMFPAFLALTPTSALPQEHFPLDMEVVLAVKAFVNFTNEAWERSQSASDALTYACQNWAAHISGASKPWDDRLNYVFKVFWHRHLLSWLERQWCLKGLRSCLAILSKGQDFAKV
ncbi:hypothetical protein K503DRAFT_867309 [Rhizopogon vinicolor AM-OR11-026]|uniref:Uncharacterized protein n=1 Tax=Rhizopogon vinicolor AM-OR11-026 TaxID=1314800 RepID=A0A1B7MW16_9AGAM|nr:hypothetical protein K503DRAFT_867309 [Rhizopogon vinicolor AM-OR11-026]